MAKKTKSQLNDRMNGSTAGNASGESLVLYENCLQCEYSLAGHSASGHCPECGSPFDKSVGAWKKDNELVFLQGVSLPRICIKCGTSDHVRMLDRRYSWYPTWAHVVIWLSMIVFPIAIILGPVIAWKYQKIANLRFGVCLTHLRQYLIRVFIIISILFAGAIVFVIGILVKEHLLWGGCIFFIVTTFIYGIFWGPLVKATYMGTTDVHVKGCCESFLSHFPEWEEYAHESKQN